MNVDNFLDKAIKRTNAKIITSEILLEACLNDPQTCEVLKDSGVNVDNLISDVHDFNSNASKNEYNKSEVIVVSRVTEQILGAAIHQVKFSNSKISPVKFIIFILQHEDSDDLHSAFMLKSHGADVVSIKRAESKFLYNPNSVFSFDEAQENDQEEVKRKTAIEAFTENLNEKVTTGKIDPLIGREEEVERVIQILLRRKKNNPMLIGETGVGKTAIAEGLASRIVKGEIAKKFKDSVIYSLNMTSLMAGTKFRGELEERLHYLVKELQEKENAFLFIDEIHMIVGAGGSKDNSMNVSNMLKPLLGEGKLRCIGATTYKEYRNSFDKDQALSRRFQKVDIVEPSIETSVKILNGLKKVYEDYHNVSFTEDSIKCAVDLSDKYILDRFLPDKAIDVIDEAGSRVRLLNNNNKKITIDKEFIQQVVAKIARIPETTVSESEVKTLKTLKDDLKNKIFGQDNAIEQVTEAVQMHRAGLNDDNKPQGSFLFAGPTGVGKTELTKELAKQLGVELIRLDMSEYAEKHSISKLIGAPAGYVGYEQGGLLTDPVLKNPHAVVLLDELEKAHSDIYNILLQIMDYGTLTDSHGKKVDFRNVTLIMTSNAGVKELTKKSIGFNSELVNVGSAMDEINKMFSPEFRNRLDAVVWFNHLSKDVIFNVVDKFFDQLKNKLNAKNVKVTLTKEAKEWLSVKGYDNDMGARPMERVFKKYINAPLSQEILFGKLENGGNVKISESDGELQFIFK